MRFVDYVFVCSALRKLVHGGLEGAVELGATVRWGIGYCGGGIAGGEETLDFQQVAEGDFAADLGRGDYEEGYALRNVWGGSGGDEVDLDCLLVEDCLELVIVGEGTNVVLAMGISELLGFCVRDLR